MMKEEDVGGRHQTKSMWLNRDQIYSDSQVEQ